MRVTKLTDAISTRGTFLSRDLVASRCGYCTQDLTKRTISALVFLSSAAVTPSQALCSQLDDIWSRKHRSHPSSTICIICDWTHLWPVEDLCSLAVALNTFIVETAYRKTTTVQTISVCTSIHAFPRIVSSKMTLECWLERCIFSFSLVIRRDLIPSATEQRTKLSTQQRYSRLESLSMTLSMECHYPLHGRNLYERDDLSVHFVAYFMCHS